MYLLRAYWGDGILETELAPGQSCTVGRGEKCGVRVDGLRQKKPISITADESGWYITGLKKAPEETLRLAQDVIPFETVCVLDEDSRTALAVYRTGPDMGRVIDLTGRDELVIGRSGGCGVTVGCRQVSGRHLRLVRDMDGWEFEDLGSANGTFLNGVRSAGGRLEPDSELVIGFCRILLVGDMLTVCYDGKVRSDVRPEEKDVGVDSIDEPYPYYFRQSPRLREELPDDAVELQAPPRLGGKPQISWASVLVTPLISVSIMVIICVFVTGVMGTLYFSAPMALVGVIMAVVRYKGEKKKYANSERARLDKYGDYLEEQVSALERLEREQRKILTEDNPPVAACMKLADGPARTLWARRLRDPDFMTLRLGQGTVPAAFSVRAPKRALTIEDADPLELQPEEIAERFREVTDCPIVMDFGRHPACGIIGDRDKCVALGRELVVEASALHSYDDLRIVVICRPEERADWEFVRWLPHVYDDARQLRYIVDSPAQAGKVLGQLDDILNQRILENEKSEYGAPPAHRPFYLFVCASLAPAAGSPILRKISACDPTIGAGAIFLLDRMDNLPKECYYVAELGHKNVFYEKDRASARQTFTLDTVPEESYEQYARKLAPVRVELSGRGGSLPTSISFLQGLQAETPEALALEENWQDPQPEKSMAVPIGIRSDGTPFYFNIHEKAHGPHGLVAGMTGSGKSEMVQSWILSMAVRFPPSAVSFVLIDFKGTGLLLPFKNLPHLAGTISDLDTSIGRNLIALENELTRRKALLDKYQVSNISAYRKLLREGRAEEPLPYLFVVIDEFAEFKQRFPDFMQAVNSVFAIGRTLGVHMVLLTQKPANVVDDKMNANTRFRWCLKVANSADSREMLHHPDAAKITNPGRAFVQVGEDEVYEEIQSFWSGAPYNPYRALSLQRSTKVSVVDLYGRRISYEPDKTTGYRSEKNEIDAVVEYLDAYARRTGTDRARAIWTSKLPDTVSLRDVLSVAFDGEKWDESPRQLAPAVGMLDDPRSQSQYPLYFNFQEEGHIAVYGAPGSGKTTLLHTLIMSTALSYTPEQVNLYLMDFGGGSLNLFRDLPQVGGTAVSGDDERINKLTAMLSAELARRKKLIADMGLVSIASYREAAGESLPYIVLVLDNFAPVLDLYPGLDNFFQTLVRDGAGCGMYLVATANTQNGINYRVSQNIKYSVALRMTEKSDYAAIVGSTGGLEPENHPGRGLVRGTPPLEFQAALPADGQTENIRASAIRALAALMNQKWTGARPAPIPVLPDVVRSADHATGDIFLGFERESVAPVTLDLRRRQFLIISAVEPAAGVTAALYRQMTEKLRPVRTVAYRGEQDAAQFEQGITDLMPLLQDRKNRAAGGRLDQAEDPYILVFVDGLLDCFHQVSDETVRRLVSIVALGAGLNVILAAADTAHNIGTLYHGGDMLAMKLVTQAAALLYGGSVQSHGVFQTELTYSESGAQMGRQESAFLDGGSVVFIKTVQE